MIRCVNWSILLTSCIRYIWWWENLGMMLCFKYVLWLEDLKLDIYCEFVFETIPVLFSYIFVRMPESCNFICSDPEKIKFCCAKIHET